MERQGMIYRLFYFCIGSILSAYYAIMAYRDSTTYTSKIYVVKLHVPCLTFLFVKLCKYFERTVNKTEAV